MGITKFDIFISYKRISLPTANNLYYRLSTRGYSVFFDLEEMRRDDFNEQLLNYIKNANDVLVLLQEGSLKGCSSPTWENDWFLREISYALEMKKNIIPILIEDYKMPEEQILPQKLKGLTLKNALYLHFDSVDSLLEKMVKKGFLNSNPNLVDKLTSVFKFYSNEDCHVYKEGKLVGEVEGKSDSPFFLPVSRKGDYRFKCVNANTNESQIKKEHIENDEEKEIEVEWEEHKSAELKQKKAETAKKNDNISEVQTPAKKAEESIEIPKLNKDVITIDLGSLKVNMIRVEGGKLLIGSKNNKHNVILSTFYISEFLVTKSLWNLVMGEDSIMTKMAKKVTDEPVTAAAAIANPLLAGAFLLGKKIFNNSIAKENIIENDDPNLPVLISYEEAKGFVLSLSKMTNLQFDLPTEEEWEYAARGGQKSKGFIYAGSNNVDEVAWYKNWTMQDGQSVLQPVGLKKPNELGIYDMSGNVWEWAKEKYNRGILRGGSVKNDERESQVHQRSTNTNIKGGVRLVLRGVAEK